MWICEYDKNVLSVEQQNRFLVPLKSFTMGQSMVAAPNNKLILADGAVPKMKAPTFSHSLGFRSTLNVEKYVSVMRAPTCHNWLFCSVRNHWLLRWAYARVAIIMNYPCRCVYFLFRLAFSPVWCWSPKCSPSTYSLCCNLHQHSH